VRLRSSLRPHLDHQQRTDPLSGTCHRQGRARRPKLSGQSLTSLSPSPASVRFASRPSSRSQGRACPFNCFVKLRLALISCILATPSSLRFHLLSYHLDPSSSSQLSSSSLSPVATSSVSSSVMARPTTASRTFYIGAGEVSGIESVRTSVASTVDSWETGEDHASSLTHAVFSGQAEANAPATQTALEDDHRAFPPCLISLELVDGD
jgi:hypothetical protein